MFESAFFGNVKDLRVYHDAPQALERIREIYNKSRSSLQKSFADFATGKMAEPKNPENAMYPFVGFRVLPSDIRTETFWQSYGVAPEAGVYGATLTRPDLFHDYYLEQIALVMQNHNVPVVVGLSDTAIPLPFVVDKSPAQLAEDQVWQMNVEYALPNLSLIHDDIANGTGYFREDVLRPLALFDALRVDYSLHRLHHYTNTAPRHFQKFILLANYQRYMDEFKAYALDQLQQDSGYTEFVEPGDCVTYHASTGKEPRQNGRPAHLPQMPAFHLKRPDGNGISFVNIGVGPSNAKTITDHLAVLRPHCWLMIGHCAGLRRSHMRGDYVLGHAYVRYDHILDDIVPISIPIPAIAEIQIALEHAVASVTGLTGHDLKTRLRTGTIATVDDRNWELRSSEIFGDLLKSRAIAVDMESATIAANGFRLRVPYGTLLCVSDKPIHGEIKLRGMASQFYDKSTSQHLEIGLETVRLLRDRGVESLHSRKLRGFDEPPFR